MLLANMSVIWSVFSYDNTDEIEGKLLLGLCNIDDIAR